MGDFDKYDDFIDSERSAAKFASFGLAAMALLSFIGAITVKNPILNQSPESLQTILFVTAGVLFLGSFIIHFANPTKVSNQY